MDKEEQQLKKERSRLLKKRKSVKCDCGKKMPDKDRAKFGTSFCDGYTFHWTVGIILSNALYQYLADAKLRIVREDWELIEKHADAIREYSLADSWDLCSDDSDKRYKYHLKEKNWREAMHWLTENWLGLWW